MPGSILLVEDDSLVSDVVAHGLADAGYQVTTCLDGHEAWERLQQMTFDLLIIDLILAGIDGSTLTRMVLEHNPAIPIIHISGREPGPISRGRDIPLLLKPFTVDQLLRTIQQLLTLKSEA